MRSAPIVAALALAAGLVVSGSSAQTASGATPTAADDVPMDDYLGLLAQISPAAREGAEGYLQAFQRRCGRALTTQELRRAVSDGDGDPVLMGMIRANHPSQQAERDVTLQQLAQRVRCDQRSGR
ncbi:hypothetical protein [Sphaerotilus sp.]|uniref:hypothetical protein n=1 Tax=Sphaerotilus sp. TaxID=2093942 RepID=UPI002ACE5FB4|nr:hypothetical protein [Sphaerotilus sp.]MDZ7855322.1 hypothetical protein [Sphaerotilus sp.]